MAADDPAELGPRAVVLPAPTHARLADDVVGWLGELGYSAGDAATTGEPVVDVPIVDVAVIVGQPSLAAVDRLITRRHAVAALLLLPDATTDAADGELAALVRRVDLIAPTADDRLDAALHAVDLAAPRWHGEPLVADGRLVREPQRWRRALEATASNCNRVRTAYRLQAIR